MSTNASSPAASDRPLAASDAFKPERKKGPVVPEDLVALLGQADRIVVTDGPYSDAKRLFESRDKADIAALAAALNVEKPREYFHCMCDGTPAIYLYQGDDLLVLVTNHHAQSIRCSLWDSDAPITDRDSWLAWFDVRNITGPRLEFEEMQAQQEQSKKDWDRWIAAIPPGLDKAWQESRSSYGQVETSRLRVALDASIPEKSDQIRALLAWYGSGAGPWSGFPSYESAAESLLLEYDIPDVVSAIDVNQASAQQLEGAARLFGGWDFSQKYPDGLRQVPDDLKAALWDHVKDTQDEDKLHRAQRAFQ